MIQSLVNEYKYNYKKTLRGVVTESKSGRRAIIADRWEKLCDLIKNRTMRNISFSIKIIKMNDDDGQWKMHGEAKTLQLRNTESNGYWQSWAILKAQSVL